MNTNPEENDDKLCTSVKCYDIDTVHRKVISNNVHLPGESLPTDRTDVRLVNSTIMGADMVCHAILPLKPLMTDWTLKWLLVRMRQFVAVEVVHIPEGLTTHVTAMIFFYWLGGLLKNALLLLVLHWCHNTSTCRC